MTYKLERFGTTWLPTVEAAWDLGSGSSRISVQELPGGGLFDTMGSVRAERAQTIISSQAILVSTTLDDLQAQLDGIKALRGVRDKLYRRMPDGSVQWCYARLDGITAQKDPRRKYALPVSLSFVMISRAWNGSHHGSGWQFDLPIFYDTGYVFDDLSGYSLELTTSPIVANIHNGGNAIVKDLIIRLENGDAPITNLNLKFQSLALPYSEIVYSGTIEDLTTLTINCGNWSIMNDVWPDAANFSFGGTHAVDDMFPIYPGDNDIIIQFTGGLAGTENPVIYFEFADAWE